MSKSYSPDPGGRSEAHKVLFQVERYLQKCEIPYELRWEASWEFDRADLQGGEVLRFDGRNWVGKLTFSAGPVTVRMLATPHSLVLAPHSLPGGGGYPCKQYSCDDILHILSAAMGWRYVSLRDALAGGRGGFLFSYGLAWCRCTADHAPMQGLYDKHAGRRYTYGDPRDQAEEKKGDRVVGGALPIHPDAEMKRVVGVAMRNASAKQQAARAELGGTPARAAGKVLGAARGVVGRGIRAGAPVPAAELQRVASLLPADSPQNTPIPTLSCEERVECAYHLIDLWSMGGCFVSRNSPVLPLLSSMLGLDVESAWKKDADLPPGYLSVSQLPGNTLSVVCADGPKSQAVQDLLTHLLHDLWSGYMSELQLAPASALILQILVEENAVDPVSTAETAELEEKGLVEVPMGKMVLTKFGCVYAAALSWRAYDALMMRYPL